MPPGTVVFTGKSKKGTEIVIRYPLLSDTVAMCDYINTLSKEQTYILFQGEDISLDEETKYVKRLLEAIEKRKALTLLAFSDNKLIGNATIEMKDRVLAHEGVFGISIAKEFRREGIGTLLMELVIDEAARNIDQLRIITLGVFANNPKAMEMYKKFGFSETGRIPKGVLHRGEYVDHIYMYKDVIR